MILNILIFSDTLVTFCQIKRKRSFMQKKKIYFGKINGGEEGGIILSKCI